MGEGPVLKFLSLGDLVADVTIANLGFPVMALSACFGGPMLNILLGIGLSGLYLTTGSGKKGQERLPGQSTHYQPYQIEIDKTLVVSGGTLLLTLIGLLIAVPANRWKMDKRIGLGLVTFWALSTVLNIILEINGW